MAVADEAKLYAKALSEYIAFVTIFRTALEDKVDLLTIGGTNTAATLVHLRAVEAAQRSLEARIGLLRTELNAVAPTTQQPILVADPGNLDYRTITEGAAAGDQQWRFTESYDPDELYTFANGMKVGWAKVNAHDGPDLQVVSFGGEIPWILANATAWDVTVDTEYEYEFWIETPDGRRSDQQSFSEVDGSPIPVVPATGKILVRPTVGGTAPGGLTSPTTTRKGLGVYIGTSYPDFKSRYTSYDAKMSLGAGQHVTWMHHYLVGGGGWAAWATSVTQLLEGVKSSLVDDGRKIVISVPPFPREPMTPSNAGWSTLTAAGYSVDPLSWAAAAAGVYNYYYRFVGLECERILGAFSTSVVWDFAWEGNGDWYPWQIINENETRNSGLEVSCLAARKVFYDQVLAPLHQSGHRTYISGNCVGGGFSHVVTDAFFATIPAASPVSSVTGRRQIDMVTTDIYPNWNFNTGSFTASRTALDNFASTCIAAGLKFGIAETSTTFTFRQQGGSTTLNGSQAFPRGTVTVASAAAFSSSGYFDIGGEKYRYTGKGATTLTGVTSASGKSYTAANGAAVKEFKRQGSEDPGGAYWWSGLADWSEDNRALGHWIFTIAFDVDNSATELFGIHEHKDYSPRLYYFEASKTGFIGTGSGVSKSNYLTHFGGNRDTATT